MSKLCHRITIPCVLLVSLALHIGCSKAKEPGTYVGGGNKAVADMNPDDVIFCINGRKVCKKDFLCAQKFYETIYRLQHGVKAGGEKTAAEDFAWKNEQRVLPMLMQHTLFAQAASSRGIAVSSDDADLSAKEFLGNCQPACGSLAELCDKIGEEEGARVAHYFAAEALCDKTARVIARDGWYHVSDEEVSGELSRVKDFNERADKMNAAAHAKLIEAKKEILSGGVFADVAKKLAEVCPEQGKEWITTTVEDLVAEGEKGLRAWLEKAEIGDISDPIDFDDGVAIVGVVMKGEGEAPEGKAGPTLYTLVRCTMYARNKMEVPTPDGVREAIAEFKRKAARNEAFTNLYYSAVIEFPNGTNFFPNAGMRVSEGSGDTRR